MIDRVLAFKARQEKPFDPVYQELLDAARAVLEITDGLICTQTFRDQATERLRLAVEAVR